MKIAFTRAMIASVLAGQLDGVAYARHPVFNLDMPVSCPGVPPEVLNPRSTWPDPSAYDRQASQLARMFADNFKTFESNVSAEVRSAGPQV
jgi:phosphoenolpyruvate carboxykinase (ATP)